MKKTIFIFCLVISISLAAFGIANWTNSSKNIDENKCRKPELTDNQLQSEEELMNERDFFLRVDNRFRTVSKEKISQAKTIYDIFPGIKDQSVEAFQLVKVSVLGEGNERGNIGELGESERLNDAQLRLLKSSEYSTDILISGNYTSRDFETGKLSDDTLVYYGTIAPENQAEYIDGYDELVKYLRGNTRYYLAIIEKDVLQPGKIRFSVNSKGSISKIDLTDTCGYPNIDKAMIDLIVLIPGKWTPASNSQGEQVEQEFVFFFGMEGC